MSTSPTVDVADDLPTGLTDLKRPLSDWLFAVVVLVLAAWGFWRFGAAMDVYEQGILLAAAPSVIAMGWFWRPVRLLLLASGLATWGAAALYLRSLGASRTIGRDELARKAKPLEKELWAACVDSVGSTTLATVLAQTRYNGIVAACGLAACSSPVPSGGSSFATSTASLTRAQSCSDLTATLREDANRKIDKAVDEVADLLEARKNNAPSGHIVHVGHPTTKET